MAASAAVSNPSHDATKAATAAPAAANEPERVPLQGVTFTSLVYRSSLGAGAFGQVYKAWHSESHSMVAVKANRADTMDASAINREVAINERLGARPHDNILLARGVCDDGPDGALRLVLQLSGQNLETFLKNEGRLVSGRDS